MKSNMWLAVVVGAAVAASGLSIPSASWAQDDVFVPAPPQPPRVRKMERVEFNSPYETRVGIFHRPDSMHQIEEWAAKIRDADSDAKKAEARKELTSLLDKYFEEDMKRRAEELARIEDRVKKLHALLEKRTSKKQEIIELQIKVLENEADGLGFFNNAPSLGKPGHPMLFKQKMSGAGGGGGGAFIFAPGAVPGPAVGVGGGGSSSADATLAIGADEPFASPVPRPQLPGAETSPEETSADATNSPF